MRAVTLALVFLLLPIATTMASSGATYSASYSPASAAAPSCTDRSISGQARMSLAVCIPLTPTDTWVTAIMHDDTGLPVPVAIITELDTTRHVFWTGCGEVEAQIFTPQRMVQIVPGGEVDTICVPGASATSGVVETTVT